MNTPAASGAEARIGVFRRTRSVSERDLDELGHVNNVVWVRYVMDLSAAHSATLGFDLASLRRLGGVWVVQRHELDYRRSAERDARLFEETWVSRMRGARSVRHCRILDDAGRPYLESTTHWAFVDPDSGRPRRIPQAVLERFEVLPEVPGS